MSHPDRPTFKFAGVIKSEIQGKFDTFKDFTSSYNIEGKKKQQFFDWLEEKNIEFEKEELEEDWTYLENRILSEAASSIWGKKYLFMKLMDEDSQAQDALNHFHEARELISSFRSPGTVSE